jgi:VIT1/CCC1 family predicted Fe2+/Mn2+ transporter
VHRTGRVGWLRAAVLGAQDGIVSTASLLLGVAAASRSRTELAVAGIAGLVAGAMSMAAGEWSSVSSQRDAERADVARERAELERDPGYELDELTRIYERRGLSPELARQVAVELMRADPLGSHLRDELGITPHSRARPGQAAATSALAFAAGAGCALAPVLVGNPATRTGLIVALTVVLLAALGAVGARLGGAPVRPAVLRVVLGGGCSMAVAAGVGTLVGTAL